MEFELETLTDYSEEAILAEIRRVASMFQGNRLSQTEFRKLSRVGITTIRRRFGSWHKALEIADVPESIAPRPRELTRERVLDEIRAYVAETGGQSPTVVQITTRLCGRSPARHPDVELHVDHIIPWSKGGLTIEENLRTLCLPCNLGKGSKLEVALED